MENTGLAAAGRVPRRPLRREQLPTLAVCAIAAAVSLLSITKGSLWGDELCRVVDPISGDLRATMKTAMGYAQPGYMLYMLLWTRVFAPTEYLLRCSNLPFAALALLYALRIVKTRGWSPWWTLAFFVHPMFAYYMDEATPYIIVYALSLAMIWHIFFSEAPDSTANALIINGIYLAGVFIHFMFGFIIVFYFLRCLLTWRRSGRRTILPHVRAMACFCPLYLPLLYLYARYLSGPHTGFGWKSILYIPYSFLGMQGAGLSRNDLRAGNFGRLQLWQCALLAAFAAVLLALAFLALKKRLPSVKRNADLLLCSAAYFAVIFLIAGAVDMGLWERHCMSAFPAYLICACDILHDLWERKGKGRAWVVCYFVLLVISAANIIGNYYYSCDDIKGVSERAAAYLAQGPDHIVLETYDSSYAARYYPYADAAADPDRQLVDLTKAADEEVIGCMASVQGRKPLLILFEKECSGYLYHYYDADPDYQVDDSCNSFKLVTNRQTVP